MKRRLSICIPTYNRAGFIGEALESILLQAPEDVEIVISDNASTDNTEEVVKSYTARYSNVIYIRQPKNQGADANFMNVVKHASGEYCWLFGSDDTMREGALVSVLNALNDDIAVLLSNRLDCDIYLRPLQVRRWLEVSNLKHIYDLTTDDGCASYFASAMSLGAAFSYLSNIVIKRSLWDEVPIDLRFLDTAYSHVYKVLSILLNGGKLLYYNDWTVNCRTGNDSFSENGYVRRVLLDIDGYSLLASTLLADKPKGRDAILRLVRSQFDQASLVRLIASADRQKVWPDVKKRFIQAGFDRTKLVQAEKKGLSWWYKPYFLIMERLRASKFSRKVLVSTQYLFARLNKRFSDVAGKK